MKKIISLLVLFVVLFGAVSPAGAAPLLQSSGDLHCYYPAFDPPGYGTCEESEDGTTLTYVFDQTRGAGSLSFDTNTLFWYKDAPGTIRIVQDVHYEAAAASGATYHFDRGNSGYSSGAIVPGERYIGDEVASISENYVRDAVYEQTSSFAYVFHHLYQALNGMNGTERVYGTVIVTTNSGCDGYTVPFTETFSIDPVIEDPQGLDGPEPDYQRYTTETGELYQVSTDGGPWNDGTIDRGKETAVSWDGLTWIPFDELVSLCVSFDGSIIIEAESDSFYIRVDDIEGEFADNINNPDPVTYSIGKAYPEEVPCEDQFMFDPEDDLINSVVVPGDVEEGVQATGVSGFTPIPEMIVTEWYAIVVTDGTWRDEGIAPDRTDMDFQMTYNTGFDLANYQDLGDGGDGVWCQSTDATTWYIQARSTDLYLRVNNNPITTFFANTGELDVSIYHATFDRPLEICEIGFETFGSSFRDEVAGSSANGKSFAFVRGADDPFFGANAGAGDSNDPFFIESAQWSVRPLEVGAWYILDTIDGPWIENSTQWNNYRYDAAVNDGSGWIPLEDWDVPSCNVALDALGHRRIYFQVPEGPLEWFLRVNDTTFSNNAGYLAWNLYRAVEIDQADPAFNPWAGCLDEVPNSYDVIAFSSWIPVKLPLGVYVRGNLNGGVGANGTTTSENTEQILSVGGTYNIQISGGPWDDDENDQVAGDRFGAEVSSDNGITWYPINEDTPNADCLSVDQQNRYWMYTFTVQEGEIWKIRVADELTDFTNNGGNLAYNLSRISTLFGATPGSGATPASEICSSPLVRPVDNLDLAGWINYVANTIRRYFTFCPVHINTLLAIMQSMKTKEPLASVTEASQVIENVRAEVDSYDWGENGSGASTSIFDISSGSELNQMINQHFFPTSSAARSPWDGGDIIDVSDFINGGWSPSSYYYTCLSAFDGYLPTSVAQGVCFVSGAFRDTGASFWIQLSFDISCLFMMVKVTKRPLQEVIYMMTGVRPWTKAGAESGLDKLLRHVEGRDRENDSDARELSNALGGGQFQRGSDGSYRRVG